MKTIAIHDLGDRLITDLRADYPSGARLGNGSAQALRDRLAKFGAEAARSGVRLEEAMSAAIAALQDFFDRTGGQGGDPATALAAGTALAALAASFHEAEKAATGIESTVGDAPLPWLAALHRINRSATADLNLSDRLKTAVRVLADTTGADACSIMLYDETTDTLALRAAVGLNPAAVGVLTLHPGMTITGCAAAEQRVIAAPDARRHPLYAPIPATGEDVYASQISVPMVLLRGAEPEVLVGVINLFTLQRREFSDDEIAFLQTVAGELAIGIENARLYSRTDARLQRKITELGTMQRVSHTIASTLDLEHVLRLIAEQAVALFNVEAAAIFRFPGRSGDPPEPPTVSYRVGRAKDVIDEPGRDEVIREVMRTGAARAVDMDYVDGSGRLFCLPLRSAREPFGALCLRMAPGAELPEDELGLLQAFSDAATVAIENATLYQDARRGLEVASALLQEMHHRVRNNLQTVAALLSIQLRHNEGAPWASHLREAISRVQAIAAVHDLLSDEQRLGGTTVDVIARHAADEAYGTLTPPGLTVTFDVPASDVRVPSKQATILALLINELVANAVKHGFSGRNRGTISIRAHQEQGEAIIEIWNDGESIPEDFDPSGGHGLGMRIIQRLVSADLHGSFRIGPSDGGSIAILRFPIAQDEVAISDSPVVAE
ncbi:MAG TPA: GAF domain-containing protein [Thermomicrobiales bacterium]|nr:GAF domain-containing protein [Thermomicrobiales bacterium]